MFFYSFDDLGVINDYVIFHKINKAKHIWEPFCHQVADTSSLFIPNYLDTLGIMTRSLLVAVLSKEPK